MNNRQGELTAHGRNCVTIIAVRASFCLIRMLICKKEWRMGDEIVVLLYCLHDGRNEFRRAPPTHKYTLQPRT